MYCTVWGWDFRRWYCWSRPIFGSHRVSCVKVELVSMNKVPCCADVFLFTLINSEKKIKSADPSDLLSSNMAAQLSSWSIIFTFQILVSDATADNQAIQISKSSSTKQFKLHFEVVIARFGGRRITDQDLESKFWLAKKTIAPPYWNSISRSGQQTLFFFLRVGEGAKKTSAQQAMNNVELASMNKVVLASIKKVELSSMNNVELASMNNVVNNVVQPW